MTTGTVSTFIDEKGFGFIDTDAADEDVFFHVDDLTGREPDEGETVEFAIEDTDKGPRAKRIRYRRLDTRAR